MARKLQVYGVGGLLSITQGAILQSGPPSASLEAESGQIYFDTSASPPTMYVFNGTSWQVGGSGLATTTEPGEVVLDDDLSDGASPNTVPTSAASKAYTDAVASFGAPIATTLVPGIGNLATDAQAVAGTASTPAVALFVTPSNLSAVFAAPPTLGGTTPAAATFTTIAGTTIHATGLITGDASATITTGATALNLASDASTGAVNIGTGAGSRSITIGNVTGTTGVVINTGTGSFAVNTTGTGDILLASADTMLLDCAGVLELNSSAGVISIGNDAVAQNMNIGTGAAARVITIGNSSGATNVVINAGSAGVALGANAVSQPIVIGNQTGGTAVTIDSGTGAINIGTTIAKTITIGNNTGASALNLAVGTGNFVLNGNAASTYDIGSSTTTGTITIGGTAQTGTITLGSSSGTNIVEIGVGEGATTINMATGATNAKTVHIADGAVANVVSIGSNSGAASLTLKCGTGHFSLDGAATSNYTIAPSTTSGTINIGGTGANTGTVTLFGGTGAQTINLANSTGGKTLAIATGAGANLVSIGSTNGASSLTLSCGTGNFSLDGAATSAYTIAPSTTSGTINIGGTGANTGTVTLFGGTGAQTINFANSTGGKTLAIATGAGANLVTIGSTNGASALTLQCGTGNFSLDGAATSTYTFAPSVTSGTINFGGTGANTGTATILGGTGAQTINIANSTGVKTLNIATGAAANQVVIGSVNTSAKLTLNSGTGGLLLVGGIVKSVTSVAAAVSPYTVLGSDSVISTDTTGGVLTLTLPASPVTGRQITIYDGVGQASANTITVDGNGKSIALSGTSAGTKTLTTDYSSMIITYNGTLWMGQKIV